MKRDCPGGTARYRVRLQGIVAETDEGRFEGCAFTPMPDGTTQLTTPPIDQPALYALLRKSRDSGMTLVSLDSSLD